MTSGPKAGRPLSGRSLPWAIIRGLTLGLSLLACQDRPATQVMISVVTDLEAPQPLGTVSMTIERQAGEAGAYLPLGVASDWPIKGPSAGQFELPGSVVAFTTADPPPKIRITLSALSPDNQLLLRRRAVLRLAHERTLFLRLGLTSRCLEDADCGEGTTCIEGRCHDEELDATQLPAYDAATQPASSVTCDSGTAFRHTGNGMVQAATGKACPRPDDVCSEGTCLRPEVFSRSGLPPAGAVTVLAQVSNPAGLPVVGAELRLEDGPVTLVRQLRGPGPLPLAPMNLDLAPSSKADGATPGLYSVQGKADPMTRDLRLTVTAPGHAPQVVSVPYKAKVTSYLVPVVLFPLAERTFAATAAGAARVLPLSGPGGQTATLAVGGTEATRVRYALVDPRFAPGQGSAGVAGPLLQSRAVLYLENVTRPAFPSGTEVTFDGAVPAPLVDADADHAAFALDLQGQWRKRAEASVEDGLRPSGGGFWTVGRQSRHPACVHSEVMWLPEGEPLQNAKACPGARVRLLGPEGVSSFDSAGADGSFCGSAAQQEMLVVAVGHTVRTIYVAAPTSPVLRCGQGDGCQYLGGIFVDSEEDCTAAPRVAVPARAPGDACTSTLECVGLASCYQGFCVGEGFIRVSMTWAGGTNLGLHVKPPGDRGALSSRQREIEGVGRMDVEQCEKPCAADRHIESAVLQARPDSAGQYEVWVENLAGVASGSAEIEIFVKGQSVERQTVTVPGGPGALSEVVGFKVP